MLVLGKYSSGFGSLLSEKNGFKIKKSLTPPPHYKTASFMGWKKRHSSTTGQEMKNSFITEMMWEILYVGNMQFPKIEPSQNQVKYLGINPVVFLLTHGSQWKLFKVVENKCQRGFVQAVESVLVIPRRQWHWHRLFE